MVCKVRSLGNRWLIEVSQLELQQLEIALEAFKAAHSDDPGQGDIVDALLKTLNERKLQVPNV